MMIPNWKSLLKNTFLKISKNNRLSNYVKAFANKDVLELGGPSMVFSSNNMLGLIPIYKVVAKLSNINFDYYTIWEKKINTGNTFKFNNRTGQQFIMEATDLHAFKDELYSGLISSHCLEHVSNPIKALLEWKRVIQKGGYILIIVPNKHKTFDHKRDYTTFEHILSDFENNVKEDDLTHFDEIMKLHDRNKDKGSAGIDFEARSKDNLKNRCLHHHVFNDDLIIKMANYTSLELVQMDTFELHLVYLLRKTND